MKSHHYHFPKAVFDQKMLLPALFEKQVAATPEHTAVYFHEDKLSYSQLNDRANALASHLIAKGVKPGSLVGLCIERSCNLIAGVLGILKTGAGYVPLDPEYPQERLLYMMETAQMPLLVTNKNLSGKLPEGKTEKILIEDVPQNNKPVEVKHSSDDIAYVLFTSGSTGMPKGVAMPHKPLVNLITWQLKNTSVLEGGKTLQFAPISFDVSFQEIFSTLSSGGTLVMIEDDLRLNAVNLLNFVSKQKINRLFLPFIALQHLCEVAENFTDDLSSLIEIITAGEQLQSTAFIKNFFRKNKQCTLWNHYGPTEGHVVTAYQLPANPDEWAALPSIGKPIDNAEIYILDENGNAIDTHEGELFIGGISVAKGYLNRDDLTAERFIINPFENTQGKYFYKTGDLAKYLPDGNIEYLGRIDGQVKIRGYRIELGEIELTLDKHDSVKQAVVVAREDEPGDKRLVAYCLAEEGKNISTGELRKFLSDKLPEYMMPSAFVKVEEFPRTPSGKIDRRNLPAPSNKRPDLNNVFVAPETELQKMFASKWGQLLKIEGIGIHDNFFDLGGNSLLALKFIAELRQEQNLDLPVVKMYQHPDIFSLTKFLSNEDSSKSYFQSAQERFAGGVKGKIETIEDGIAVIGMSGRFPGAKNVDELWKILLEGKETVSFFRKEELDTAISAEDKNDPSYVAVRGVIADADKFDAPFFNVNPRLAEVTDPQQRIFLEIAWEAFENAGYCPGNYNGLIGIFAGMGNNTYYPNNVFHNKEAINRVGTFQTMTANEKDYIATRVAYEFNTKGPGLSIHTACSTSLTAVTIAYESLLNRECDMALAGGIAITVPVNSGHIYNEGGMFSKDGHTRAFDADATGTVFSDGAGAVILKRYKDAVNDGDEIYAVIRGAALNNDGSDKASFTAPSVEGQAQVVAMAQAKAGVEPESISYIETHGTATPLGDPIEIEALTQAFRSKTDKKQFCAVGSIKTNIGHLTPAAGVTGLIKTCLALKHKILPASLNYKKSNPAIDFENSPFYVNATKKEWKSADGKPLRAGVSSFGVGGTNAHVVLEEAPSRIDSGIARQKHLFVLSAKTKTALDAATKNLKSFFEKNKEVNLADAAYTLQTGRKHFNHRRIIVGGTIAEFNAVVDQSNPKKTSARELTSGNPEIIFMFPGQGSQYVNMGKNLYDDEIVFKDAVDTCCNILQQHLGLDLRTLLFPKDAETEKAANMLRETAYTQPALFTIGYALAKLWMSWGIQPKGFIGHSIGEFAAAHLAGVFSLEDALMLVANRGRMMQDLPRGSMLSVRLPAAEIEKELDASCSIAANNGPALCVVAGPTDKIEALRISLEKREITAKLLVTSHAFHSPMMEPMLKPFLEKVKSVRLNKPSIPFVSTATSKWITDEEATNPEYWVHHVRATVRFAEGIQTLWNEKPQRVLLECGPRNTATMLAKQQAKEPAKQIAIASLSDNAENYAEWEQMLFAVGQLWMSGAEIDWKNFYALEKRKKVALPTYPFEKKRYWLDPVTTNIQTSFINHDLMQQQQFIPNALPHTSSDLSVTKNNMNRKDLLTAELKSILEESSGMELGNDSNATFIELGLDSLFLTQAALTISKKYGVKITFRQLNEDFSSLNALATHLDSNLPADAMPAVAAPQSQPAMQPMAPQNIQMQQGMNPMQMMMMQQMQMMQMMMQQMSQPVQSVAPSVQAHIEKAVEIKSHTKKDDISENEKAELAKPFGAIARIEKAASSDINEKQSAWLNKFVDDYTKKTAKSKQYCQQYRSVLADPRVVTGFKPALKEIIYQVVVEKSKGVNFWDLDGNKYVDVLNGFGSNFFGWGSDVLMNVWKNQLETGIELGPQTPLAGECAKLMCEITGYDRAGFCNTGSEAVLGAMRIARTVTGRNLIVCFNGSYHGINDEVIVRGTKKLKSFPAAAGIMPESVENMLVLDYGTDESLQIIKERIDEIAAVMIEPIQSRRADFHPKEFIHEVRKITKENNVLMIFDEVITGFRLRLGGAQEYYGVDADLSTYGKVIGGNMPIGAIAGRKPYMDALDGGFWQYGDHSIPEVGVTYFAGTFVRHPLAMAAMKEVLTYLKKEGKPLYEKLNSKTQRLVDEVNAHSKKLGSPFKLVNFGSLFKGKWETEPHYTELLFAMMRFKGVHIMDGFPCFLTLAFTDADVDFVIAKFKESLDELCTIGFIPTTVASSESTNGYASNGNGQHPPIPGAKLGKDANGNPAWFISDPERPGKYLLVK
jgi:amino acid adenylation domain-containing protein